MHHNVAASQAGLSAEKPPGFNSISQQIYMSFIYHVLISRHRTQVARSTCHCRPSVWSACMLCSQALCELCTGRWTKTFFCSYSSGSFPLRSLLSSCCPAIRRELYPSTMISTSLTKGCIQQYTSAPIPSALSVSALLAGHPITAVAPNFVLAGYNSRLWLTQADGGRTRAQYTGLQGSWPKKKKKKNKSLCCILATQPALSSPSHIQRQREGGSPLRQWGCLITSVYLKLD